MSNIPASQSQQSTISDKREFLLSLVIPCYNESARTDILLKGVAEFEDKWKTPYEVIVVDDGSRDDTVKKIQEGVDTKYTFLKNKLRIEQMPANGGKGAALKRGVAIAQGDYVLTLDADMSTKPTELINWEKKDKDIFRQENTVYIASRKHEEGKVEALASRKFIGGIFNSVVQIFTTLQMEDTQCGFKLYPRKVAKFLFGNMQSKGWAHDVELLYQADLNNIAIKEMPIYWVNMPESKVNVVKDSVMMFIGVLSISFRIWLYNSFKLPFKIPEDASAEQKKHIIYRSLFNVLSVLLVIVMPVMSFQYGITGDEHWHFDYGNSILNYFFHGDMEAQTTTSSIQYYGGIFDFTTAMFYNVFRLWDHYTTMHFINAIVGAIGIIYAGKLARLLGGYNTALLAVIFLILSPSWFGHNFANPKDIPFSAGYTASIYYSLLFLRSLPKLSPKNMLGLICSIGWAMGVRIGGLLLIAYLVFFIGAYALYYRRFKEVLNARVIKQFLIVAVIGYFIAIFFWPFAHADIIGRPLEALKIMSNFYVDIGILYDGKKIMSNQVPWYYVPKYISYTAPVIILIGAVIGILGIAFIFRKDKQRLLFALLVIFIIVFPVGYAIYKKSSLYDGWRHFLFIYPPLVVMASVGWFALINSRQKPVKYGAILLVIAGLALPAKFAIANHPFETLYFNEISGGIKNIYGRYETDYYMMGVRPATQWLIKNEHILDHKTILATNTIYPVLGALYQARFKDTKAQDDRIYERYADFRHDSEYVQYKRAHPDFGNDNVTALYVRYTELYELDWDYCILFSRFVDPSQLISGHWPPADTIHTIKVDDVVIAAILKRKTKKDFAGFKLLKEKKIFEAKDMFMQSLQEYPTNPYVWEALAQIYEAEGKFDSTIYAGRRALQSDPGNINVHQLMGTAFLKQQRPDSAVALYKSLEQYNPGFSHFFMAYNYAMTGNGRAALGEIDNAIEADPYNQQAYKLGMQIAQQMKDQSKMEEYQEKAEKAFPPRENQQ